MSEQRFERILAIANPYSRHARTADKKIDNLREHYGKSRIEVVKSLPRASEHRRMVQEKILQMGRGTWAAVLSGDGPWGDTLTALAELEIVQQCGTVGVGASHVAR